MGSTRPREATPKQAFRAQLISLMWKFGLAAALLAVVYLAMRAGPRSPWLTLPGVWGVASLVCWRLLRRGRDQAAAWALILGCAAALCAPFGFGLQNASARLALQSLAFAFPLLVSLAGLLLPVWSGLILLGLQACATFVLPQLLGRSPDPLYGIAFAFTAIGVGLVWATARPIFEMVERATAIYRRAEARVQQLDQSRGDLRQSLAAQDALNQRLAGLNAALTQRTVQLRASAQVSQLVTSADRITDLVSQAVPLLYQSFQMHVALFLLDRSGEWMTCEAVSDLNLPPGYRIEVDGPTAAAVCAARAQTSITNDAERSLVRAGYHIEGTRFEAAIPLLSRGEVIGVLDFQKTTVEPLDEQELSILTIIAEQIASGIASIRAVDETRRALQDLQQLRQRYVGESWDRLVPRLEAAGYRWLGGNTQPLEHRLLPDAEQAVLRAEPVVEEGRLVVPISYGGQVLGVLGVSDPSATQQWTDDAVSLVQSVAEQMGQALENARLFEDAQERLAEITALQQNLLRDSWEDYLAIKDDRDFVFRQPGVPSLDVVPPEAEQVVREKSPMSWVKNDNGSSETAFVAPIDRRGQVIGLLGLQELGVNRDWSQEELEIIEAVTSQLSSAIENAQLFESLQQRAAEIERVAEQLREIDQFRADFLATMSHELRTPLNSIIGFSRVILKGIDGPLNDMQRTDLEAIYNNGQNLLRLINDILDQSKIDAGKMELILEGDVNLAAVLENEMAATLAAQIADKPVEPRLDVEPDLPLIRADSTRIRQVIRNLMSNAAKFTDEGSITVRAWVEEDLVYVSIEDTGIGMPSEKLDLVFEKFRQLDSSSTRAAEGTGLGMPISRTLVEMHGGRIWVESTEGAGTQFTFYLPVAGPMAEDIPELADLAIDKAKKLLLVVERSEGEVATYRRFLESVGYQLVGLYDPHETVRWSRYLNPFAIMMESDLDGDQGWELLEQLRTTRHTRMTPVIVCSKLNEGSKAINMGASAFVRKPVVAKQVLEVLGRLSTTS